LFWGGDLVEDVEHPVGKSPEKELESDHPERGGEGTKVVTNATGKIDCRVVIFRPSRPGCFLGSQHHIPNNSKLVRHEVLVWGGGFILSGVFPVCGVVTLGRGEIGVTIVCVMAVIRDGDS
jgi:hypothetical protein